MEDTRPREDWIATIQACGLDPAGAEGAELTLQLDGLREHLVRDPLTTPGEDAARATLDDWPSS